MAEAGKKTATGAAARTQAGVIQQEDLGRAGRLKLGRERLQSGADDDGGGANIHLLRPPRGLAQRLERASLDLAVTGFDVCQDHGILLR
jgi:hypothetical protein